MSDSRLSETLQSIGGCLMFAAFTAIPIILLLAFVKSIGWVVESLLPVLGLTTVIAALLVPVFLLLAIPRKARGWAGLGITLSSYAIGIHLWVWSLVISYAIAGIFWLIVGLLFAGVGVVAVAAIASALRSEWIVLLEIVGGVVIVYLLRALGGYLIEKSEPKEVEMPPLPPEYHDEDGQQLRIG